MSRKHKRHVEDEPDPEFQVAPMVDVLLVLLMFFMSITSTEVMKKVADLKLPEALHSQDKDKAVKPGGEVVINVSQADANTPPAINVDMTKYETAQALAPLLTKRKSESSQIRVLIRADEKVEYRVLADIMKVVGGAQIGNVTFAVMTSKENVKPAPAPAP